MKKNNPTSRLLALAWILTGACASMRAAEGEKKWTHKAHDGRIEAVKVKIVDYRYSGFSWRGPESWNKDNSQMTTSEGRGRDDANGTSARWVVVSGPTPAGTAFVLMMSAASEIAGGPEKLRVWDSKNGNGTPFVNFNPVMDKALLLDDEHPAVSNRKYRVIAADRMIDAADAEAAWKNWMGK
jgi:hypothetical protein